MIKLLFKSGVFLCLIFIILSFFLPAGNKQPADRQGETAGMFATAAAVGSLLQDMDGFCRRNPQACATGKSFFGLMAEKARQGAAFAYQWLGSGFHKGAENTEQYLAKQGEMPQKAESSAAAVPAAIAANKAAQPTAADEIKPAKPGTVSSRGAPDKHKIKRKQQSKKPAGKQAGKSEGPGEKRH
ncbi:MAG: hypothetical protein DU429_03685 [Candidatus Tokpelaia sp.]|nr:MAG: hypothetical protein DU430_01550 [Candidatus Tokpelaia sp.]KAA6207201.1 MAG: hypothetical protein DU429_03685 [Candidatus Tokpelaia sp.]